MKLSYLVYECVKDSINMGDTNFNYYSFLAGDYNNNKDYINQIAGVFNALNLAFSRLYDNNKIAYFTELVELVQRVLSFDKGSIVNIARLTSIGGYERLAFRTMGNAKEYYVMGGFALPTNIIVEYKKAIPHFTRRDIQECTLDYENKVIIEDTNLELDDYGITAPMISYIKEFVRGQLLEYIAPDLANMHNNRAEQYFQDLENATTAFVQPRVKVNMKGYF